MKKNILFGLLGAVSLLSIGTNALAHDVRNNCGQDRRTAATIGGFVGAGAGAATGHALAATSVRPEGVVLGTLVGAVIGASVGRQTIDCNPHNYTQDQGRAYGEERYEGRSYGEYSSYDGQGYAPQSAPEAHGGYQGWYEPSRYGYYGQQSGYMNYAPPQAQVQYYQTPVQYVPTPQYVPPVQYIQQPAPYYPPPMAVPSPCPGGQWVCR